MKAAPRRAPASVPRPCPLPPQLRLGVDVLLLAAWGQVSLGVATLVNCVPVHLGSAHQAGALTLFSVVLFTLHTCRVPHAGRLAARLVAHGQKAKAILPHRRVIVIHDNTVEETVDRFPQPAKRLHRGK